MLLRTGRSGILYSDCEPCSIIQNQMKKWKKVSSIFGVFVVWCSKFVMTGSIPLSHAELMISSDDTLGATVRTLSGVEFQLRFEK